MIVVDYTDSKEEANKNLRSIESTGSAGFLCSSPSDSFHDHADDTGDRRNHHTMRRKSSISLASAESVHPVDESDVFGSNEAPEEVREHYGESSRVEVNTGNAPLVAKDPVVLEDHREGNSTGTPNGPSPVSCCIVC